MTPNVTIDDAIKLFKNLDDNEYFELFLPAGTRLTIIREKLHSYVVVVFAEEIKRNRYEVPCFVFRDIEDAYCSDFQKFLAQGNSSNSGS